MLTALVSSDPMLLDTEQLLERVPHQEPAIGVEDISAWIDQLQLLLDWGLVVREPAPHAFIYKPTVKGVTLVYGYMPIRRRGAA
jgi:hypothetical protein